jgi:putative ABC transport system permease protein
MDVKLAGVIVTLGAALGLLAAVAPAWWTARASLPSLLASTAVRGGARRGRMRRGLIVAQVALSLVLLASGGLIGRSFERLLRADPGFRPEGLLTVLVRTPPEFFPAFTDAVAFQDRVHRALAALPGVTGASAATALPLTAAASQATIAVPGAPGNVGDPARDAVLVDLIAARAGYVEVMGMRLVEGRTFGTSRPAEIAEALIDSTLARRLFPTGSAVGTAIPFGNRRLTVIGVVDQARLYDVHRDGRPQILLRSEDSGVRPHFFVVRTAGDPLSLLPDLRAAIGHVDPRVAVGNPRTMEQIVSDTLRQQRTSAALVLTFAAGALLLAAMGLFGVVAGSVMRRRHEIAVRMALGASASRVLKTVVSEGALLVAIGVAIGLPSLYAAGRLLRGLLVDVTPSDPLTLIAAMSGLLLVTIVACYVPARRALRIEPAQLLKQE